MINALVFFHMLLLAVWVNMSLPTSILIDSHYKPAAHSVRGGNSKVLIVCVPTLGILTPYVTAVITPSKYRDFKNATIYFGRIFP